MLKSFLILGVVIVALFVLLAPSQLSAQVGRTYDFVRVIDGGTIEGWENGREVPMRLVGVDAPLGNTRCGIAARGMLWHYTLGGVEADDVPGIDDDEPVRKKPQ